MIIMMIIVIVTILITTIMIILITYLPPASHHTINFHILMTFHQHFQQKYIQRNVNLIKNLTLPYLTLPTLT